MTAVVNTLQCPLGNKLIEDIEVNGTVQDNVTGAASIIYYIAIDNSNNKTTAVYLKIWDSVDPDISTDDPSFKFKVEGGGNLVMHVPEGIATSNGISYACVTAPQVGIGTSPSKSVTVRMITS